MPPAKMEVWFASSRMATGLSDMTEREKIHSGNIYWPNDPTIMEEQLGYLDLMDEYNRTPRRLQAERAEMLNKLFAEVGGELLH